MRRLFLAAFAAAFAAALGLPVRVQAQAPLGPIPTEEAGPLQRVGLTHTVQGADLIGAGVVQAETSAAYSNIFAADSSASHQLLTDLERLSTLVGVRWGVATRLEVGGRLGFETTGGGILDPLIQDFHHTLHLPNANRARYPSYGFAVRLTDGTGKLRLDVPKQTMALEEVRLFAKWLAWRSPDGSRLLSLSGTARFPTVEYFVGSQRADVSLMALGRASWTRWTLHASLGGSTVRAARDFDGLLRPAALFADVAAERALSPRTTGVAQLSVETSRFRGFGASQVDGVAGDLVFGLVRRLGAGWHMDVSFQEDVPPDTPAADFTLRIGFRGPL